MAEIVHAFGTRVLGPEGDEYVARVCGIQRADGCWEGWLEFVSLSTGEVELRTGRETTQRTRAALAYWSAGLEPTYIDAALGRARPVGRPSSGEVHVD